MTERGVSGASDDEAAPSAGARAKPAGKASSGGGKRASSKEEGQVSQALRTVYQRAIDEDIPAEMLDLLKKLD